MVDGWLDQELSLKGKRVWVAGHRGMVGSAVCRRLAGEGCEILRDDLDLRRQADVEVWMVEARPDVVILAAAKVGGIGANSEAPANFLYDNLMIEANVIHAAAEAGVEKLLFLGSSCIYPKDAQQPIAEEALLTGALEPTNEAYAVAKIAGVKLCAAYRAQKGCDFIAAMPCNLYGPGDRFDEQGSHVIPAVMMKMHAAKEAGADSVSLWGTGAPLREFLYVDDLADALVFLLQRYSDVRPVNVGSGAEISIADLASKIADVVGYEGRIVFDPAYPDGTPRKIMDCKRIHDHGWSPDTELQDGLRKTYVWYQDDLRLRFAA